VIKIAKNFHFSIFFVLYICLVQNTSAQITVTEKEYAEYKRIKRSLIYGELDSVRFKLTDMSYACGDCRPRYRVDYVLSTQDSDASYYYNKEIFVEFLGEDLKEERKKMTCMSYCYTYILHGYLKENGFGLLKLEALGGVIMLDKICCDKK